MDNKMMNAYFLQIWKAFGTHMDNIYNQEFLTPAEFMQAKKILHDPINIIPMLGDQIYKTIYCYLTLRCAKISNGAAGKNNDDFLEYYRIQWRYIRWIHTRIDLMCTFLNRDWIEKRYELQMATMGERNVYVIGQLCLIIWKKMVYHQLPLNLTALLIERIRQERLGAKIDTRLMSEILGSYVELGFEETERKVILKSSLNFYITEFGEAFMRDTIDFYERERAEYITAKNYAGFEQKLTQREIEERGRYKAYLPRYSFLEVTELLETLKKQE